MSFYYFLWGVNLILLGLILYRAYGNRMFGQFPIFYAYIGYVFIGSTVLAVTIATYGRVSSEYYYVFNVRALLIPVLQLWVLRDLYQRILGNTKIPGRESTIRYRCFARDGTGRLDGPCWRA